MDPLVSIILALLCILGSFWLGWNVRRGLCTKGDKPCSYTQTSLTDTEAEVHVGRIKMANEDRVILKFDRKLATFTMPRARALELAAIICDTVDRIDGVESPDLPHTEAPKE